MVAQSLAGDMQLNRICKKTCKGKDCTNYALRENDRTLELLLLLRDT